MGKHRSFKTPRGVALIPTKATKAPISAQPRLVASLLDEMRDGHEYESIVSCTTGPDVNLMDELVRAIGDIQDLRGRPVIAYCGNVVRSDSGMSGVDTTDDVPFSELVASVPAASKAVDVLLSTRGGNAHQVSRFVNALRARFDDVHFLIPSYCMSAGTLFALSGDRVWMTSRACLGPIDPQVPSRDGRFVPAQALLLLVDSLQKQGQTALDAGHAVPWTAVRIIDSLDKKDLADAMTASQYSLTMAFEFLIKYKFRSWITHKSTGATVTDAERAEAASVVASALASHDKWKAHGHAISREVLWETVKLQVNHPDAPLERALHRYWALCNWLFEKTPLLKVILSPNYRYAKGEQRMENTP